MAAVAIPSWDSGTGISVKECVIANRALARIGAEYIRDDAEDTPSNRQCKIAFPQTRDELLRDYNFNFAQRIMTLVEDVGTTIGSIVTNSTVNLSGFVGQTVNAHAGKLIVGTGIPTDTYIISNTATTAVMSKAATASATISIVLTSAKSPWEHIYVLPTDPVVLKVMEIAGNKENQFEVMGQGSARRILCNVETSDGFLEVRFVERIIDPDYWDSLFTDAFVLRLASKLAIPLVKRSDLAIAIQQEFAAIFTMAKNASSGEAMLDEPEKLWTDRTNQ